MLPESDPSRARIDPDQSILILHLTQESDSLFVLAAMRDPADPSILLEKIDPAQHMARFYAISVEPTLFAETALVRRWGRVGTAGRQMIELHASPVIAEIELRRWVGRKLRRGYIARD